LGVRSVGNALAIERIRKGTASLNTLTGVMEYIKNNPTKKAST